jgi:HPt (histidine-containing phosphotransfer) domain-containing protein
MNADTTPVDLSHLDRYTGGNVALNREILALFSGQAAELLAKLHRANEEGDARGWRDHAHALKGGARGIGAFGLGELAATLEKQGPRGYGASRGLKALDDEMRLVADFIALYRRG